MANILPRSYDRNSNPEAIGVAFSKDVAAFVIVSNVGPSDFWLYVREGSYALEHCPFIREWRQHITYYNNSFDFDAALGAIKSTYRIEVVGTEATQKERLREWERVRPSQHEQFYDRLQFVGVSDKTSAAALCLYFWNAACESSGENELTSYDDLTVVNAILNGLVALDSYEREREEKWKREREEREAQSKAAHEEREAQSKAAHEERVKKLDLVKVRMLCDNSIKELPRISARSLVALNAAKYV